jgi:peptidoglycan/xylan/chitin deacetylase (PgdA/CDA1 family)
VGWPAGITLSRGESALPLLKDLPDLSGVHLDSEVVAATLWSGLDFGTRTGLNRLARNWPAVAAVTREWVEELGARAQAPAVVPRVMRRLELLLADLVPADARPDRLGHVGFRSIELSQLDGPVAAEGCERLRIRPSTNGVALREVTVPVAEDGMVSRATILDAVGWLDGWSALEEYFARSLYPSLERRTVASGVRICRNGAELAMMSAEDAHSSARLHQEIGWCVFLQELWGERSLPLSTFYDTVDGGSEEDAPLVRANGAVVPIELSDPLPIVSGWSDLIPLEIRLGGARVGALHLRGFTDPITPAALRGQITRAFGLGLMRVAVRQAVLGWPPGSAPLRERLREAARTHLPLPVTSSDLAVDVVARSKLEGWRKVWASLTPRSGTERRAPMRAESLRILMYHRVAPDGDPRARRYRITPEEFGRQLDALSARGFTFRSLSWCHEWLNRGEPFPMKSVVLTFDDAYLDFYEYAWPILQARSLSATLFVPTGFVGKSSEWDKGLFTPSPLLSWQQITRLHAAGIEIGAHTVSHPALTSCSPREIATELTESRRTLEDVCSEPIRLFAYPYGDCDTAVRTLVGDAGYSLAVTTRPESARPSDDPLTLPRVEVLGGVPFERFERAIS